MLTTMTTDRSAKATTARDEEFRRFFVVESDRLRRLATFMTGDAERGAELAQEALVRTYRHWNRIRNEDPGPYARRILVNLIRSAHRRSVLERTRGPESRPEFHEGHAGRVNDWLSVSGALMQLPPVQRATVVLRFYEDLSEAEIGRVLDRPVGTVKSDLHRALKKLRPLLEGTEARHT
jgi:RNA polymerase sigma-70 factor (sigma-E family)